MSTEPNILEVEGLKIHFGKGEGLVKAVDDVSFFCYSRRDCCAWSAKAAVAKA